MTIQRPIGLSTVRVRRRLAAASLAVLAATVILAAHGDARAASPQNNTFVVRGNMCGNDGWNPFTTANTADNISVWCYSKASIKKLSSSLYQSITEDTVCQLRCAVRKGVTDGRIATDPWPSQNGCASFVHKITRSPVQGSVVYAAGSSDGSGTGNHCHITGPTKQQLQNAFANHYDCTGYVCQ